MDINTSQLNNNVKISREVIARIGGVAVKETKGVAGLSTKNLNIKDVFGATSLNSPFKVLLNEEICEITVNIILESGVKIKDVCQRVQNNVKATVQNMTGITVSKVNVYVAGVATQKNENN